MDSGAATGDRTRLIQAFAPKANERPGLAGTTEEVDLLISTDVLSEGQNLQDCGVVVNYDLHWNPTRMVQRAGRVDRLLSPHETIWIYNLFPDEGLERLLRLVESLNRKITDIDRAGFLDASVLGETVHPRNFNTLKRIEDEDGAVVEEEEQFAELASNEFMLQQLRQILDDGQRETLEALPDGIHSGLARQDHRGVFFYFTAPGPRGEGRQHFWRYVDLRDKRVLDNRFLITNLIACSPDTARVIGDADVFALQERVIDHIVQQSQAQVAVEAAPKIIDPMQQTVATVLRGYLNHPEVDRQEARQLLRVLSAPMPRVHVRRLRELYASFSSTKDVGALIAGLHELPAAFEDEAAPPPASVKREDLHLVCFDFVWS
jgi:hypothetical protein